MINVKFEKFIIYAKVSSTSKDSLSYDAWVSVGSGMSKKESATVTFSKPRHNPNGDEATLDAAIQADLSAICLYLDFSATPKEAFAFLKNARAQRIIDDAEWQSLAA